MSSKNSYSDIGHGKGEIVVYQSHDGQVKLGVRLERETLWMTQSDMAQLFQCSADNISLHLKNIFEEGELNSVSTTEDFSVVRQEGVRQVARKLTHYNLDVVISVGYRIKSLIATRFRIWATQRLKEYIVKGFALNDERLKGRDRVADYFDELLAQGDLLD
ncbi:MAG: RhuM family protein [Desulfobacterales bacterium]|nr:RhuM family protein [Desulfobacterales bacterium]